MLILAKHFLVCNLKGKLTENFESERWYRFDQLFAKVLCFKVL